MLFKGERGLGKADQWVLSYTKVLLYYYTVCVFQNNYTVLKVFTTNKW